MKIVRVTRRQLRELDSKLRSESRRIIRELTISNLYLQMENILLVADDDVEFCNFPSDQEISISNIVMKSFQQDEKPKMTFSGWRTAHGPHEFMGRHSAADNTCEKCGLVREDSIHTETK